MAEQGFEDLQLSQNLPFSQDSFKELWDQLPSTGHNETWRPDGNMDMFQLITDQQLAEHFDEKLFELPNDALQKDGVTPPASTVPVTTDYPGEYGFQLRFQRSGTAKSVTSTVSYGSSDLGKSYNCTSNSVEVFSDSPCSAMWLASSVKVRVLCSVIPRHPHHLLWSAGEGPSACKALCVSQQYILIFMLFLFQLGSEMTTILLSFMCNSSCMGGMNRRPILTILTLETPEGLVLGRRCFEVRVCACPGRDRKTEEDNKQKKESGTKETKKRKSAPPPDTTSTKKSKCTSSAEEDDKEVFLLPVRGRERYEMLKKINDGLELLDKDSKSKSKVSVKHEVPVPSSGKRLLQRGERSDSD
uniref:Cellular tumor antigen p53 n=2 Tax=Pundamilia nyererei TaxID=303518 RepID=A0A3B4FI32_9CICH